MSHDADDNGQALSLCLPDETATLSFGALLSLAICAPMVIDLEGNLGAGKTTLVRGVLRARGYQDKVKSPTYTLLELYPLPPVNFYHFDFYRLNQPEEFLDAGFDELFREPVVCLVEWPDKARPYLPAADLVIQIEIRKSARRVRVVAEGSRGQECLKRLMKNLPVGATLSRDDGS